jgi:hypothetical protein
MVGSVVTAAFTFSSATSAAVSVGCEIIPITAVRAVKHFGSYAQLAFSLSLVDWSARHCVRFSVVFSRHPPGCEYVSQHLRTQVE